MKTLLLQKEEDMLALSKRGLLNTKTASALNKKLIVRNSLRLGS